MLTKKFRTWWRNFEEHPEVELRIGGRTVRGRARASVGDENELETLATYLETRPLDAKAYGVTLDADSRLARDDARALLPQVVVVRIELE